MRMLIVGAGAVGESILRILQWRDPEGKWLEHVIVSDYDIDRAKEVCDHLTKENPKDKERFIPEFIDAHDTDSMVQLIKKHNCDFVADVAAPFVCNNIFDAAYKAKADYVCMGTWTVPFDPPQYGYGLENSFSEWMADYNFKAHDKWKEQGNLACICLGIDPGVVDVFAKFAAEYLFDELKEIHVKDGGDLRVPGADKDAVSFGFNVWTVLDECLNPNVEWSKKKGFKIDPPFSGQEVFDMPAGVGPNTMVKVEHEETVLMPKFLQKYGLEKCSFKIALDDNLIQALKSVQALGLRNMNKIDVGGVQVAPRDVVAAAAPQPKDIGDEMIGKMVVGIHCIGKKDGKKREVFMYQPFDNKASMKKWQMQAVVAQTGFGAAIGIELMGRKIWKGEGVFSPEYFDPLPYLEIMDESDFEYGLVEMDSPYKASADKKMMHEIFKEAKETK
ncbi:MAG: saccharopine dehydrogenase NADP-binding domain-containing protein [Eubacteriaceae bacterium]|nr:saccharopine dehydrogenase NADP-binding domain-containing protein [Eubacteriaceae bacterium]